MLTEARKNDRKLAAFISLIIFGLALQMTLGMRCRCHWGAWTSRFIEAAFGMDLFLLAHTVVAVRRGRFYDDCLITGLLVLSSSFWIPFAYQYVTKLYLLFTEGGRCVFSIHC